MQNIILGFLTSLLIVVFGIPSIITVAKLKGLYDNPNSRKIHTSKIPRLGGLAIIAGFAIAASLWGLTDGSTGKLQYMQAALIILFFSGLKDDIIVISPVKKLISQIVAAAIVIFGDNIRITGFYGFMGIEEMPYLVSVGFTLFTIIVITNAFNLIDGVDGLAGGIGFIASTTFGMWFSFIDETGWAILSFALSGALLGFLVFNYNPAKIFMGDSGSLTIGFLLSILAIRFIEFNHSSYDSVYKVASAPAIAIGILIIPLFDTIRVFVIRMIKKQSPFQADQNHMHHSLIKIGLSHREVCLILYLVNVSFVCIAFLLKDSSTTYQIVIQSSLAIILSQIPTYIFRHRVIDLDAETKLPILDQFAEQLGQPKQAKNADKN
jgi:UDP-GlcNAc:undecaprenyl-phosphate GlcNAc-1-phosphate transferase